MRKGSFGIAVVTALACASLFASFAAHATVDAEAPQTVVTGVPAGNLMDGVQVADPGSLGTFTGTTSDGADAANKILKLRAIVTNPMGDRRAFDSSNARGWFFSDELPANSTSWRWSAPANNSVDKWLSYDAGFCIPLDAEDPCPPIPTPDTFFSYPGNYKVSFQATDLTGNFEMESPSNTAYVTVI